MKVSDKDREVLANLYDSGAWNIFRKLFLVGREAEINREVPFVPDWDGVQIAKGRIIQLREIEAQMQTIKKKQAKQEKS
jgi:hypothetical protein